MSRVKRIFTTFLKSRVGVSIFGGVLLALLLALTPNYVSAYKYPFNIPDSSPNSKVFTAKHNIYGGCLFKSYTDMSGGSFFLGDLKDGSHNCGYYHGSNDWTYDDSGYIGYSQGYYSSNRFTYSSDVSGSSVIRRWDNNMINNYGNNAYNVLHHINLTLQDCTNNPCDSGLNLKSNYNGSAIFVYAYKSPLNGASGTTVRLQWSGGGFDVYDSNDNYLNTSVFDYSEFAQKVENTILYGSFNSSQLQNLLPDNLQYMNLGEDYTYIIGSIPTNTDYYLKTPYLSFYPADGYRYNWSYNDLGVATGLTANGYYNFLQFNAGSSYKNSGVGISELIMSDSRFAIAVCDSQSECDYYNNFTDLYIQNRNSSFAPPTEQNNSSSSIFMNWFDVFNFGFTFPFRNFFEAFTDSTNCVSIPIIGGMLHNPNANYCSWWSSDIRNVLTPVFSLFSIMLLTTLIIHWLKGYNGNETIKTKRGEK